MVYAVKNRTHPGHINMIHLINLVFALNGTNSRVNMGKCERKKRLMFVWKVSRKEFFKINCISCFDYYESSHS